MRQHPWERSRCHAHSPSQQPDEYWIGTDEVRNATQASVRVRKSRLTRSGNYLYVFY
jgi:hypothetical protein